MAQIAAFPDNRTLSGAKLAQAPLELEGLAALLRELEVTSFLEVGSRHGDTLFELAMLVPSLTRFMAVDLPGGRWGRRGSDGNLDRAAWILRRLGHEASVHYGRSLDDEIVAAAKAAAPWDFILIDADHTYKGVKGDWNVYGPMAGKAVAFHDIVGQGKRNITGLKIEVPRLWEELKAEGYQVREFVDPPARMGIGVLLV
ncbi:MAG: class I SAM-dependent methyltransferase [Pseudomonadota bacterium]